ncbi:DNA polymerase III subunit gamma/tau [Marilutibacter aestuarii]|uniref:DNA polymerase III subunit gamma/tau n=1 Tax=Marilutibacter aestuarii TaxID=1706195 RepID=A0A508A0X3_9GAMM|nr:DNA polymerase III subunit gamma/tau [Lysobacter aestuarii]TQD42353.1 DNA polymerase III subunit gamma/tau [Lysobacter aestuarii]
MSYLVLARKWRPRRFAELVGQEHVVKALTNALDSGRIHHAFLFTGTRGVGKTTIARIFAKSLNCEQGTSADPCGECASCKDIDAGRFIDLLEIDAASNTGVDDVREVIDNAQYMPSRGRVKVYLIDEVHMLSKSAFNALLKTLEEPPGHVKFLLATTDPQKLPVTVLSRCLQFNLKRLDEAQITGQINRILEAEGIPAEAGAVRQIARGADGSLRDGLSLLDQAIAYTGAGSEGAVLQDAAVATMLGTVDRTRVGELLAALADGDGERMLAEVATLSEFSPDWAGVLDAFSEALHRVQVRQLVPSAEIETDGLDIDALAGRLRPEVVQLWYQMALGGRRDLGYAPSPRAGFEMSLLRMLAFRPAGDADTHAAPQPRDGSSRAGRVAASTEAADPEPEPRHAHTDPAPGPAPMLETRRSRPGVEPGLPAATGPVEVPATQVASTPVDTERVPVSSPATETLPPPVRGRPPAVSAPSGGAIEDADDWHGLVESLSGLKGPAKLLAEHAVFVSHADGVLVLALADNDEHLRMPMTVEQLSAALETRLGVAPQVRFEAARALDDSLHARKARARDERQSAAEAIFMNDPEVQRLIQQHGATVVPDSIRPFDG